MKRAYWIIAVLFLGMLFVSCEKERLKGLFTLKDLYSIQLATTEISNLEAEAVQKKVPLETSSDKIEWRFSSMPSWILVSDTAGKGSKPNLEFLVRENNSFSQSRTAVYYLNANAEEWHAKREIVTTQEAKKRKLSFSHSSRQDIGSEGARIEISITANTDWKVELDDNSFATLSTTEGEGDAIVILDIQVYHTLDIASRIVTFSLIDKVTQMTCQQSVFTQYSDILTIETEEITVELPYKTSYKNFSNLGNTSGFTTKSSDNWLTIMPEQGVGDVNVQLLATTNTENTPRIGYAYIFVQGDPTPRYRFCVRQTGPNLDINPMEDLYFEALGGSQKIHLGSNTEWTAEANQDWIKLSISEGDGNQEISITVGATMLMEDRRGTISFIAKDFPLLCRKINVLQQGLLMNDRTLSFPSEAFSMTYDLMVDGDWTATTAENWIEITPTAGNGNTSLQISVTNNQEAVSRSGCVEITSLGRILRVLVLQESSWLSIPREDLSFPSTGGKIQLSLSSNVKWGATASVDWLDISPASGQGNVDITLTARDNASATDRGGEITITTSTGIEKKANILQKARYLDVSVSRLSFLFPGGSSEVLIQTDGAVEDIEVSSIVPWITTKLRSNMLLVVVQQNTGRPRQAAISIRLKNINGDLLKTILVQQNGFEIIRDGFDDMEDIDLDSENGGGNSLINRSGFDDEILF